MSIETKANMLRRRGFCFLILSLAFATFAPMPSQAQPASPAQQAWPTRPVTIVVPFAAGSGLDVVARILAEELREVHGQPFVVENRPGAGATLGTNYVAKAAPDGYTLVMGGNTSHSAAKALLANVPYDPVKDFTPVARLVSFPTVIVTNAQQPFKTIGDFVSYAKAQPGKLSYGAGNSTGSIVMEGLNKNLGINVVRVPYKSNPTAVTDLLGNQIQMMAADFPNTINHIKAGTLVALAVTALARNPLMPDVPTVHETVVPNFELVAWAGLYGPANMSPAVVKTLSDSIGAIYAKPAAAERLRASGPDLSFAPSGEFETYSAAQVDVWTRMAKDAGITPQ